MKNLIFLFATALMMSGCDHSHDQAAATENPDQIFFGEKFDLAASVIPAAQLETQLAGKDTLVTVIEGTIDQTCPHAGCWLNINTADGQTLKATTDHVFFVPVSGCEGLKCKVAGKAYMTERSVETQKHYAMEEGKTQAEIDAITTPLPILAFTATGVMIEGYKGDVSKVANQSCEHDHAGEGEAHDHAEGEEHNHDHATEGTESAEGSK